MFTEAANFITTIVIFIIGSFILTTWNPFKQELIKICSGCNKQLSVMMFFSAWIIHLFLSYRFLHVFIELLDVPNAALRFHSSVQFSCSDVSNSLQPHGLQHTRLPCPSPTAGAYSNSYPSRWWCHPTIPDSIVPFFSRLQSVPASGFFPMSQFFALGGQSIRITASASVLPMNIQDWFPLGWTAWISMQSKGLSRVFSNTTVQNHQFFSAQLSL